MTREQIIWNIKNQRFKAKSLWCVFNKKRNRDNYRLKIGFWEGPGEYRAIEFPHKNSMYFILTQTFDELRLTCQECGESLRDPHNFLRKEKEDIFICDTCDIQYKSLYGSPLVKDESYNKIKNLKTTNNFIYYTNGKFFSRNEKTGELLRIIGHYFSFLILEDLDEGEETLLHESKCEIVGREVSDLTDDEVKNFPHLEYITDIKWGQGHIKHKIKERILDFEEIEYLLSVGVLFT